MLLIKILFIQELPLEVSTLNVEMWVSRLLSLTLEKLTLE